MRLPSLMIALAVAGCATAPSYSWHNPTLPSGAAVRQHTIDSAECRAHAMQAVALPAHPAPPAAAPEPTREYSVDGSTSGYSTSGGAYTGSYNATIRERPSSNFYNAFEQGRRDAQANRAYQSQMEQFEDAVSTRADLADVCMLNRGWMRVYAESK